MNLKTISLDKLNPAEYNPRTITDDEFNGLVESLKTFGQQENLIVNKDMTIISGHQRYEAMKFLDWTEATCNVVDLDKHQEKKLNVIMNSTAISGKYDDLKLSEILEELKLDDDYESLRLDKLEPLDLSEVEVEEDEAPEVSSEPPVSKLGEVYQLGRHRVMCGDSTDKTQVEQLMDGVKADMVFTDPPYNISIGTIKHPKFKQREIENDSMSPEEFSEFCVGWATAIKRFCDGIIYCWGGQGEDGRLMFTILDKMFHNSTTVIWAKDQFTLGRGKYHCQYEPCWFGWNKDGGSFTPDRTLTNLWNFDRPHKSDLHPTMKPIEVCAKGIEDSSKKNDIVLDLFLGSGSTLIACEQTDRICYGMELDPKYVDVIRKRYWKFINDGNEEGWQEGTPSV